MENQIINFLGYNRKQSDSFSILTRAKLDAVFKLHQLHLRVKQSKRLILTDKPMQNADYERFNGTYRHEVLDNLFISLVEARIITKAWLDKYNYERTHDSLSGIMPTQYKQNHGASLSTLMYA